MAFSFLTPQFYRSKVYAATGINSRIHFQGKVVNSDGTNVNDGTYDFVFKMYDGAASASNALFTENWTNAALFSSTMSSAPGAAGESLTYSSNTNESTLKVGQILWNTTKEEAVYITSVNTGTNVLGISPTRQAWAGADTITNRIYVNDGVFIVELNSINTDLSGVDFNSDSIYLGVNFNGDGEMKPRVQYTSVPYAFNAEKVNGLTVTNTTGTFTLANSKTLTVNNTLTFSGTDGTTFTFPTGSGTVVTLDSTGILTNKTIGSTGLTFSGANIDVTTASNENFSIVPNGTGKVGVGTTSPGSLLTVSGGVGIGTTSPSSLYIGAVAPDGGLIVEGNVGIGSTNPGAKFEVSSTSTQVKLSYDASTYSTLGVDSSGYLSFISGATNAVGRIQVGLGGNGNSTPDYFALDVKSDTGDPAGGFEGAMYYNTADNKFRCFQGAAWADCIGTGGAGPWTDGAGITYLTDTAEDFAVGATTLAAPFSVDVSANTARIGTGTTSNAVLSMYGSDGDNGTITYTTNDGWSFAGGNVGIGTTNAASDLEVVSAASTGTAMKLAADSLSSGIGFNISSTSTALTTGTLASIDWSPGSAATATGDLFSINIGSNGTVGNLFNVKDNGTSLFLVSETSVISSIPASFTAAGDVSIAYDLAFTNQTASYIKTNAPFTIEVGELWESNDLTFKTYNSGNVIFDAGGKVAIGSQVVSPGTKLTVSGGVAIGTTSSSSTFLSKLAPDGGLIVESNVGIGTTNPTTKLSFGISSGNLISLYENTTSFMYGLGINTSELTTYVPTSANDSAAHFAWRTGDYNGTELMRLKNNGNLGIGTTNPGNLLEVFGASTQVKLSYDTSNSSTLGVDSSGYLSLRSGATNAVGRIQIGLGGNGNTTPDYFALDVKSDTGDPAGGFEGAMYYNTADNKFRCFQGAAWADCIGTGGAGPFTDGTGTTYLTDSAENLGIGTTDTVDKLAVVKSSTASGVDGVSIAFTQTDDTDASDTNAGLQIDVTNSSGDADNLYGINIAGITGGSATEYALVIGAGWDRGLSVSSASTIAAALTIGSGGNTFTFDPATGPVYAGTARPTQQIKLSAEYSGATLTASNSASITGNMTADTERDADLGWMNYYEWTSTQGSYQDYSVAVKIKLPSDFSAWATSNAVQINYATEVTDNAKNKLDVWIYNMTENPDKVVTRSLTNASSPAADWETLTIDDSEIDDNTAPDWDAADETAIIYLKASSLVDAVNCTAGYDNGCYVRMGDITLNYVSKY